MEILKKVILILAIFTIAGVFGQGFDTLPEANPAPKANYFYKDKNGKPTKIYKPNAKMSEFAMKKNKNFTYSIKLNI